MAATITYLTTEQRLQRRETVEKLGERITELAAHLAAGEYRFLTLLSEFDERDGWKIPGMNSCAHWLNWTCGIALGAAREKVRVAKALPGLPQISKAFSEGRISYSKVRAMTRVATARNEKILLNVALHGTAHHVEKQVQLYRRVKRIEALKKENDRHAHRKLTWRIDDDGYWMFKGRFTPEQGAVITKALEAAMDSDYQDASSREVGAASDAIPEEKNKEPIATRRADALQAVAETYLAKGESTRPAGERYIINLHTDIETLAQDGTGAESELENCCNVPAETSRRLACDASIIHWHENANGDPLNVGRKTRTIPPAIRRALQKRDQGCRFPGCTCTRFVDAHHIRHWADGGETKMGNLVLLCRRHHRLVHEGGFGVTMKTGGEVEFIQPNGKVLPPCPAPRSRGNVFVLKQFNANSGHRITHKSALSGWRGEKMDPELAVLGLIQKE